MIANGVPLNRIDMVEVGDIIVRYNNRRIWNARDLQTSTSRGVRGETVTLEIERDGQRITLRAERGPLGMYMRQARTAPDVC